MLNGFDHELKLTIEGSLGDIISALRTAANYIESTSQDGEAWIGSRNLADSESGKYLEIEELEKFSEFYLEVIE